jgi:hypothetical protein
MNKITVAPSAVVAIFAQLPEPNAVGAGYVHEGIIPCGQIVTPNKFGRESYTPKQLSYRAKVIPGEEKLKWEIQSIKILGAERTVLSW